MEDDILNERINLITKLKDAVGRTHSGGRPLNVMLIGTPGCGMSSFVNSFAASVADDHWREYAISGGKQGTGLKTSQNTVRFKRFKADDYVTSSRLKGYAFPTLIDIAGFPNEDSKITEEILRLLFYGQLEDHVNIQSVFRFGMEQGVEQMRWKYFKWYTEDRCKVDRVVVIAAVTETIPGNLIECVMRAARPTGDKYTREIPVFGVLTKFDQVDESRQEFKGRKEEFITNLSLVGATHRLSQCANYCDEIDPTSARTYQTLPDVDVPILRFMNVVCGSQYVVNNPHQSYRSVYFWELAQQILGVGVGSTMIWIAVIVCSVFMSIVLLLLGHI